VDIKNALCKMIHSRLRPVCSEEKEEAFFGCCFLGAFFFSFFLPFYISGFHIHFMLKIETVLEVVDQTSSAKK